MFAIAFHRFGTPSVLEPTTLPLPDPGPGQVRIRVHAAGVSPVDLGLRAGTTAARDRLTLPHVPGVDAAGTVDKAGPGVTAAPALAVFGSVPLAALGGATAEYAVLDAWAPKPGSWSWAEAGAAASSVETATRALDRLGLEPGMTLLVTGAPGGVGSVVLQLAAARGARVLGVARPASHDFVAALGATPVERIAGVRADRALDIAGNGVLPELIAATGDPSRVLTLADLGAAAHRVAISFGEPAGEPTGRHGLTAAGGLRIPIRATFAMSRAAEAHELAARPPRQGKIVLLP